MNAENLILAGFLAVPLLAGLGAWRWLRRLEHTGGPVGWPALLAGNALIGIALVGALVAAGELYFRFLHDQTDSFALTRTTQRWIERHYALNNMKVRDSLDYRAARADGRRRLTFIGDSFTAGHGVPDVEQRFANRIRARWDGWEIHVFAKNGIETGGALDLVRQLRRSAYALDVVVYVYGLNDISDLSPEAEALHERLHRARRPGLLARHSFLLNTLHYRLVAAREPAVRHYYDFLARAYDPDGPVWAQQRERLAALHEEIEAGGGRLLVVTFPFLHALGPNDPFVAAHATLGSFWRSRGVAHLDLLPVFRGLDPGTLVVNARDAHPNAHAHELAARAIDAFLRAQLPPPLR